MGTPEPHGIIWRTSSYTTGQGNCVEVALAPARVLVRDTKDRPGGALSVSPNMWGAFLRAAVEVSLSHVVA